eukprot:TRINITY_DN4741_c0_g1_i1.p1 TRINITY_DN4741_c0_g1~~TRINITY_DN4741_c0_g1_i1.p1  ORF type:complete len:105 (-),score=23.71 TRINITY_DN4741_c0_g1_i1:849-1163(-)
MQRKRSNSWFQNALATVTRKASLGHEAIQEEDGDLVHEDLIPEGEKPSEAASSSSEAKPVDFQHPRTVVKYKAKVCSNPMIQVGSMEYSKTKFCKENDISMQTG